MHPHVGRRQHCHGDRKWIAAQHHQHTGLVADPKDATPMTARTATHVYVVSVYGYDEMRYMTLPPGMAGTNTYRDHCDVFGRKDFDWWDRQRTRRG
jgi:hypothetical protein